MKQLLRRKPPVGVDYDSGLRKVLGAFDLTLLGTDNKDSSGTAFPHR